MSDKSEWTPRLWQGCSFPAWVRLLWKNRCAVAPRYFYMPMVMTTISALNSVLGILQESWYGSKLEGTVVEHPPLFIIGHWRTGTTLLHEVLTLDRRFSYPSTYACLAPHHFLLTEPLAERCLGWMLPSRRPMDNMAMGWSRPQEDEFALCLLGQPSPYQMIAFPNHPPQGMEALALEKLPRRTREQWKRVFLGFVKRLTFRDPRRLLLKSPTHSCRIPTLLELFPQAQFLHIVRNPYTVFTSTKKLWQSLYRTHGLQVPTFQGLEEHIFTTFSYLYSRIEEGKRLVSPENFYELRYEDFVADPVTQLREIYHHLRLGDFEKLRSGFEEYWRQQTSYQTNRYAPLEEATRVQIAQRWQAVLERYGYSVPKE